MKKSLQKLLRFFTNLVVLLSLISFGLIQNGIGRDRHLASKKLDFWADYRGRIEIWSILGCALLFVGLLELVRRNRLKERYSFLWFLTVGVLFFLSLRRNVLEQISSILGVYYPPTALFLILVFGMILILIHFSTVISRLLHDKQVLAQHVGLLESRLRTLEHRLNGFSILAEEASAPENPEKN